MNNRNQLTPFGRLVVKALVDRGMSKGELAGRIGTTPQYLSQIMHGVRPGFKYLAAITAALDLDPEAVSEALAA